MRLTFALTVAAAALSLAACDQLQKKAAPAAPPAQAAAAPAPAAPPAQDAALNAVPAAAQAPAGPAPAVEHWSRADFAKREARLAAMIANAETRDTSGETQRRAEEGRYQRARCASRACIEASYASEETWLRQWEGSGG